MEPSIADHALARFRIITEQLGGPSTEASKFAAGLIDAAVRRATDHTSKRQRWNADDDNDNDDDDQHNPARTWRTEDFGSRLRLDSNFYDRDACFDYFPSWYTGEHGAVPVVQQTIGNGSCQHNAAALALWGDQRRASELAFRKAVFFVRNQDALFASAPPGHRVTSAAERSSILASVVTPYAYQGVFGAAALATMLQREVYLYYPETQTMAHEYWSWRFAPLFPLDGEETPAVARDPLIQIWTSMGIGARPGKTWNANHFSNGVLGEDDDFGDLPPLATWGPTGGGTSSRRRRRTAVDPPRLVEWALEATSLEAEEQVAVYEAVEPLLSMLGLLSDDQVDHPGSVEEANSVDEETECTTSGSDDGRSDEGESRDDPMETSATAHRPETTQRRRHRLRLDDSERGFFEARPTRGSLPATETRRMTPNSGDTSPEPTHRFSPYARRRDATPRRAASRRGFAFDDEVIAELLGRGGFAFEMDRLEPPAVSPRVAAPVAPARRHRHSFFRPSVGGGFDSIFARAFRASPFGASFLF